MKEVQFRRYDKKHRQMVYGIYELYETFNGDHEEILSKSDQFTGLRDRNGVKIWEGDILEHIYDKRLFNWLISYNGAGFVLQNIGIDGYLMDKWQLTEGLCIDRQVIGNMHNNPELLKNTHP